MSHTGQIIGKTPIILYTTVSDKMAYGADPEQIERSDHGLHCFHSAKNFKKQLYKQQNSDKTV